MASSKKRRKVGDYKPTPVTLTDEDIARLSEEGAQASAELRERARLREVVGPAVDFLTILASLPRLTGNEVRALAKAMPKVAGEWETSPSGNFCRTYDDGAEGGSDLAARVSGDGESHEAMVFIDGVRVRIHRPTAVSAQAWCDRQLQVAGVKLCGEGVTEGRDDG